MASCLNWEFYCGEGVRMEGRLSQKPSVSLILNYESAVIHTIAKEAFLLFLVSDSMDHELPHGFQQQCEPWTSAWLLEAAWTTDLSMVSSGSTDHENEHGSWPQHGLWNHYDPQQKPRSWKSTWPQRQHGPWTSSCSLVAAQAMDINTVLSHNMDGEMNNS